MGIEKPATPALDRMIEVRDKVRAIVDFLEWLEGMNIELREDGQLVVNRARLAREFFGIDMDQVERERVALMGYVRMCSIVGEGGSGDA